MYIDEKEYQKLKLALDESRRALESVGAKVCETMEDFIMLRLVDLEKKIDELHHKIDEFTLPQPLSPKWNKTWVTPPNPTLYDIQVGDKPSDFYSSNGRKISER
jgi:tetrahydromethanopterin S-methyltransferase subunit B